MIDKFSFGSIVVDGAIFTSDIKIIDGCVVSAWWRKSGHRVALEDIQDIIAAQPAVVVIGKGAPGMMKTSSIVRNQLKDRNIRLIEEKTAIAINTYNRLAQEGENVAAGFHLGC